MIDEAQGRIDYDECGSGPAVVLLPGSCSTGAAWRPVIAVWGNRFRSVTTSLLGYGGTSDRRTAGDPSNSRSTEAMDSVRGNVGSGSKAKYSQRADVFRSAPNNRHRLIG